MKIAVYPGSFDPVTKGHIDIVRRASKIFDKVIVVIMVNTSKTPIFSTEERIDFIKRVTSGIDNVEVDSYVGLVVDYARKNNVNTIIKGLRAVTDFENEFQQALTNKQLNSDVETMFLVTSQEYMFLSSTVVREIAKFGADITEFVPEEIKDDLLKKIIKG